MKQTAVEWLVQEIESLYIGNFNITFLKQIEQAKEMEKQEKLTQQLFIGKVSEIIGFSETVELLKECKEIFKK
jgi:hypothetical protein